MWDLFNSKKLENLTHKRKDYFFDMHIDSTDREGMLTIN